MSDSWEDTAMEDAIYPWLASDCMSDCEEMEFSEGCGSDGFTCNGCGGEYDEGCGDGEFCDDCLESDEEF